MAASSNEITLPQLFLALEGSLDSFHQAFREAADPWECDAVKRSVLHAAAVEGREDVVGFLLAQAPPEVVDAQNGSGYTPLQLAVLNGKLAVVMQLLAHGADPKLLNSHGEDALQVAAGARQKEVFRALASFVAADPANDPFSSSDSDLGGDAEIRESALGAETETAGGGEEAIGRAEMRVSQVVRTADQKLQRAQLLVGSGRHALTSSVQQEATVFFSDVHDMLSKVEILMQRYESEPEVFFNLILIHGQLFEACQRFENATLLSSSESSPFIEPEDVSDGPASSTHVAVVADAAADQPLEPKLVNQEEEEGPSFECQLCWDDVPMSRVTTLQPCGHQYCSPCIVELLANAINSGEVANITCPQPSCRQVFSPEEIERLAPAATFERYQQFRFLASVRSNPHARWCSRPGCETAMITDASSPDFPKITCTACAFAFCAHCRLPFHGRQSCRSAEKARQRSLTQAQRDAERESTAEISRNSKPCPSCGTRVSRDGGCAHMHCPNPPVGCGGEFCYLCGERILVGGTFPMHYKISQCAGLQFYQANELPISRKITGAVMAPFRYGILGVGALIAAPVLIPYKISSWRERRHQREEGLRRVQIEATRRQQLAAEGISADPPRARRPSGASRSPSGSPIRSPSPPQPESEYVTKMESIEGDTCQNGPALRFQQGDRILVSRRVGEEVFGTNQRTFEIGWIHQDFVGPVSSPSSSALWTCSACTLVNDSDTNECIVCGSPNP
ncbi:MAG: IBR domain-containing protein [archaeon]|nr:IBR domain-containing protein [archaeon]